MTDRYVVSAQRSGLNWFRYCFEVFYGRRTPGQTSVLTEESHPELAFVRTHDALNFTTRSKKKDGGSWTRLDPANMAGCRVLLLLRDPLESFVRMADGRYLKYQSYISNIKFYCRATQAARMIGYYEDLVKNPDAMCVAMQFLDIPPAEGHASPDATEVQARWDELGAASRANYTKKQSRTGGAHTKDNPTDFTYHQRSLSASEQADVWAFLRLTLTSEEFQVIRRYAPKDLPAVTLRQRIMFLKAWLRFSVFAPS